MDWAQMSFNVIGGLCIFLLGMKHMSEGMQAIAGNRLRKMIAAVTDNRFMACGTGAVVTSLIQSSSVTTVMLVGFVNAGIMTLRQSIGVILGADIGTTITAWIVSLNVVEYGLVVLGIAGFFFLFAKNEKIRYTALMIMGVGMVFFGLQLMKDGLYPLRNSPEVIAWFSKFEPDTYFGVIQCVIVGALVTAIVQSSSATVAITITLAQTDVIGYETAVALVLGENIGTTITAYLASLGASTNAKRVAYAHILIKVIAVLLLTSVFPHFMNLLKVIIPVDLDIAKRIAFSHTTFNVILVCLFLPFVGTLAYIVTKLAPEHTKEIPRLTFLDVRMLDTPAFGIQQSSDELVRMSDHVKKMFGWLGNSIIAAEVDEKEQKKLFHREEVLDAVQKEIVEFLGNLLTGTIPHDVMEQARKQLRIADEYESVGDYIVTIHKLRLKIRDSDMTLSDEAREHILDLHNKVTAYVQMISEAVKDNNMDILAKAKTDGKAITHLMKNYRQAHLARIESKRTQIMMSLIFTDILASYRKIKDHAINIAEALVGEK